MRSVAGKNVSIIISLRWVGQKVKFKVLSKYTHKSFHSHLGILILNEWLCSHTDWLLSPNERCWVVFRISTYSSLCIFLIEINLYVFSFPRQLSSIYLSKTVKWFVYCRNSIHFNLQFLIAWGFGHKIQIFSCICRNIWYTIPGLLIICRCRDKKEWMKVKMKWFLSFFITI